MKNNNRTCNKSQPFNTVHIFCNARCPTIQTTRMESRDR